MGRPFRLEAGERKIKGAVRQQMADEVMYLLSALLPERYRGAYADLDQATTEFIAFLNAD